MKRLLLIAAILLAAGAFVVISSAGASNGPSATGTYKIELDNAFGLVNGEEFKVNGVDAGTINSIDLDPKTLHALVTVSVSQGGFGQFHSDVFCESRPQSLIGEYFLNCNPGQSGPVLAPGTTIPVTHTESTIPADLLADIMRMPYRERLTLIINELGAGVAGQSGDLQAAIQRAVPALTETDNLLALLANDSHTIQDLTATSNSVVTALANNSAQVQKFITEANNTATDTATQQANLKSTFQDLPGFLEQLRPALARLEAATAANTPVLQNLNASSGELDRLLTDLPSFSRSALSALKSLGKASVTGKVAVTAAAPVVKHLNQFATPTPELAQNLAIVLHDLDDRGRAVEKDPRSPGGQGYTGLEALLQYVFNQTLAIDYFGPYGHELAVDAFVSPACSGYATPSTIATNMKLYGTATTRGCYSWLGPNQPGINETDPTDPSACVPDPGGAPPGRQGPATTACSTGAAADTGSTSAPSPTKLGTTKPVPATRTTAASTSTSSGKSNAGPSQTQQLLSYLLSP